jgi:hypothetical protein
MSNRFFNRCLWFFVAICLWFNTNVGVLPRYVLSTWQIRFLQYDICVSHVGNYEDCSDCSPLRRSPYSQPHHWFAQRPGPVPPSPRISFPVLSTLGLFFYHINGRHEFLLKVNGCPRSCLMSHSRR